VGLQELAALVAAGRVRTPQELQRAKLEYCRRNGAITLPRNSDILNLMSSAERGRFLDLLRTKPTRTASGVAVVAAVTSPAPCPHGRCTFCPGGPEVGTPQSYLGTEPAIRRAAALGYDPFAQVSNRLEQLRVIGHATDKVELVVIGGTFTARSLDYQRGFLKGCIDALNGRPSPDLTRALEANEGAANRCVGLAVESKPDCFVGPEVERSLEMGLTRIELGVQSVHGDVLAASHRGHTDAHTRAATARSKDWGLKVGYHMMIGLPRGGPRRDLESFDRILREEAYLPDHLKIYPTLVVEGTPLHGMWRAGAYEPPSVEEVVEVLVRVKAKLPPWVRIQRIQREFAAPDVRGGIRRSDLRYLVSRAMADRGLRCPCLRCREVGLRGLSAGQLDLELKRSDYRASGGREVFLSFEDVQGDAVAAYLRLRLSPDGTAFVREVKVVGTSVPLHESRRGDWQHRGLGRRLMVEAMGIARGEWGCDALLVTSGVGVREYYRSVAGRLGLESWTEPHGHVALGLRRT
jgi:elongator complex protein 3